MIGLKYFDYDKAWMIKYLSDDKAELREKEAVRDLLITKEVRIN